MDELEARLIKKHRFFLNGDRPLNLKKAIAFFRPILSLEKRIKQSVNYSSLLIDD